MNTKNYNPIQSDPFSLKTKLKVKLWQIINKTFFKYSPFFCRKYRVWLIRLFGADVDWTCSLDRHAIIDHPWNLKMGPLSSLKANSWTYCLDKITIGEKCCISKHVFLLTGSHKLNSLNFDLITMPIVIKDCVWLSTRANILPGVTINDFAVIGANSVVTKSVAAFTIVGGNPAKFIKQREIK
ncbi:putative colanic acid biosynthesis acetyltransferase [Olleya sp. Ti.3.14]|uniref:putative colanic acid biosynthesis acetyltransferase n=1 Tax=Olleya sp. Ti.3.14 TaxID=3121297 RepID=UPI00311DF167